MLHLFLACTSHALDEERNRIILLMISEFTYTSIREYRNNFAITSKGEFIEHRQ